MLDQGDGEGLSNELPSLSGGSAAMGVGGNSVATAMATAVTTTAGGGIAQGAEDLLEISENLTKLADELQRASADSPSRSSRKHISENGAAQEWYQVEARASAEGKHEAVASAVAQKPQLCRSDVKPHVVANSSFRKQLIRGMICE